MEVRAATLIYFSGAGTTRFVSERCARALGVPARLVDITPASAEMPTLAADELAVFAVPSYGGRIPAPVHERLARCAGNGTPAALLVTYGNRAIDDTLLELADAVETRGFVPVSAAAVVAHHSLMTNVAEGRPDAQDLAVVDELAHVTLARLAAAPTAAEVRLANLPGNRPYRAFGGVPFHPQADASRCTRCGACAAQCPTDAIDAARPAGTDDARCISCMRCVAECPAGARSIGGGAALTAARAAFALRCAERRPSYLVG